MSNVYNNDPEYGSVESTENPHAVWIRDIPSWMTKERFYNGISDWNGVIKDKSHFFKNKQNAAWNGWAKVTFTSTRARNTFIENPDQHFIQFAEDEPWERLKVTPWFDKNKSNNIPLYKNFEKERTAFKPEDKRIKADLTGDVNGDEVSLEEFDKNISNNWSCSYKGVIGHYFTDKAGNGHVGYVEIKLLVKNVKRTELIIFHSDSIWMCFKHDGCHGTADCAIRCGVDNFLPRRLPIGSEVYFTARKIPRGMAGNKCYQATTIWIGNAKLPDFVKSTPVKKLDEYLEDFKKEAGLVGGSPSKELTPENLKESLTSSRSNSGSNSPTPVFGQASRQKPLPGGLKQLGGKVETKATFQASKKQPANFAQAVARPTLTKALIDEQSNLILAIGLVESIISECEAILVVPEYGKFTLHIRQLDLGYTPSYSIGSYINPKADTVSVTLKSIKLPTGAKTKYDIVRAHINKASTEPRNDPFPNELLVSNGIGSGCDSWEDLADEDFDKSEEPKVARSISIMDNSDNDINAGAELDDYFDNLQEIMDYLERELPKVLPTLANDTDLFQHLSDSILGSENESQILKDFLVTKGVSQRSVTIFVEEFTKFRNLNNEIEDLSDLSISENVEPMKIPNGDIITVSSCTTPESETIEQNNDENTIRFKSDAEQRNPEKALAETTLDKINSEFRNKINLEEQIGSKECSKENQNESKVLEEMLERFMLDFFLKQRGKNQKEFANIEKEKTVSHIMATGWASIGKNLEKIRIDFEKRETQDFEQFYEELYDILSKELSPSDMDLELCSGLTALFFVDGWYKNKKSDRNSGEFCEDKDLVTIDMETQELVLTFLNWVKQVVRNKEMLTEKIDLYADVLQNQRNVIKVWAKVIGSKDEHFISFLNKSYLDQKSLIDLRIWLLSKRNNFAKFIAMFEADTNTFRMEIAGDNAKNEVLVTRQKRINLGLDLKTSQLEEEFIVHQDKAKETRAFILRALTFLKKCGVSLDNLAELHNNHLRESPKLRNREFKMRIENFLYQKANQKFLDETNLLMQKQSKSKEHTPYSSTRVDKYVPILAQNLCGFFVDRLENSDNSKLVGVSERASNMVSKSPVKSASNGDIPSHSGDLPSSNVTTNENSENKNVGRKRRLSQTDEEKEKKALSTAKSSSNSVDSKSNVFIPEDYVSLKNFLEISIESKTIDLPINVSLDGILYAFQARDIPFNKLESIYENINVSDSTMWRLQISQLRLNPPVGVTVPQIADMLHSYFETVGNKFKEISAAPEAKTVDESNLLSYMQGNLYDQFYTEDLRRVSNTLSSGTRDVIRVGGFGNMMAKLQEVYKSHQLYSNNRWKNVKVETDLSKLYALLTSAVWWQLNVTLDYLRKGVKDLADNNTSSKELMTKWARFLETSDIFPGSILDTVTIMKATMTYFSKARLNHCGITEIVTDTGLYNIRGVVTQHLSEHFAVVQTPYGLVLCQSGTVYIECCKNGKAIVPLKHWATCQLKECLAVGTRVLLHGTRLRETAACTSVGPMVCQVATIVWRSGRKTRDPPESGPLLPGSKQYFDLVYGHARKYARINANAGVFSNVNEEENLLKYNLALEAANQEKKGISCNGANEDQLVDEEEEVEVKTIWEEAGFDMRSMRNAFVFCNIGGMTVETMKAKWGKHLTSYYNYSEEDKSIVINRTMAYFENDSVTGDMLSYTKTVLKKYGIVRTMELLDDAYPENVPVQENGQIDVDVEEEDAPLTSLDSENEDGEKEHDTIHDESMQQAQRHLEQLIMDNDHEDQNPVGKKDAKRKQMNKVLELNTSTELVISSKETRSPVKDSKEKEINRKVSRDQDRSSQRPPIDQATLEAMAVKIEDLHYWQIYTKQYIENNTEVQLNRDVVIKSISERLTAIEEVVKNLTESLKSRPNDQIPAPDQTAKGRTYVKIIKAGDSNDVDEVPTNSRGLLPQSTVKALYEGTSAIKYRVTASSKTWRTLLLEDDLYHPPEDGWGDRIYHCTIPQGMVWKSDASQAKNGPPLSLAPGTAALDSSAYTADSLTSPYPASSLPMTPSSLPMFSSSTANSLPVINVNPAFLTGLPGIPILGQQQQQSFPAGYHLTNMKPAKPWFMKTDQV